MKVVIFAGGKGTRLSEYTSDTPKPLVPVHSKPIIHHIMDIYAHQGYKEFVVALGYKGSMIVDYFRSLATSSESLKIDILNNKIHFYKPKVDYVVTLVDTGLETATGGRLKKLSDYIEHDTFMFTYGDGVANVSISDLINTHRASDNILTLTAVHPPARFGELNIVDNQLSSFQEKPQLQTSYINGGFFIAEPSILDYIQADDEMFEREPINRLVIKSLVGVYKHTGFWQCMDTRRDKDYLESFSRENLPWLV